MILHFKIAGGLLILVSLIHLTFPKNFSWVDDLRSLSLINREMMKIHTFFIALTVFLMGLLCIFESKDLIETSLGKSVCLGLGIFWVIRLIIQFFGYSSEHWRGKKFETFMHIVFSFVWTYFSVLFLIAYFN